ncbi:MAG: hypothetical protein K9I59_00080 [Chlorobium sp.]|uniref:hypothetical protein n=1 Tax=Chlorobium sp. TaxID=1095 RepID=UPI0025C6C60B|nr:hypothetical protein [Chlorobium sp.]MCF8215256.1 hypothetical protein [Chlorobium sp.]MCF8270091.1 hypothetical protein [Chlorobium sp.]MCF8286462.1 hypothetical protein [Chlorobium sp.]MCF8290060.1 hypothetical protein [Chlorobium sp.]MCF8384131.1 hypothetical protein [Chlorobium sp.]
MNQYAWGFYANRHERTLYSAERILSIILRHIPAVHSAVEIGCEVGTCLTVFNKSWVKKILGIDGSWVEGRLLEIPENSFMQAKLQHATLQITQTYDLDICLEIAEHLPTESAKTFVVF